MYEINYFLLTSRLYLRVSREERGKLSPQQNCCYTASSQLRSGERERERGACGDMNNSRAVRLVAGALGAGSLGWAGGVTYQKYKDRPVTSSPTSGSLLSAPGLPLRLPTLQAATALVPSVQDSGLVIPARETGVPPEPRHDAPRVSQIMRSTPHREYQRDLTQMFVTGLASLVWTI